jgi:SAM-dependent methyltransferase
MAQYQTFPGAPGDSHTLDKLKALRLPDLSGKRFLDVGCNEGFFCGFAHFQGASRVVGIDQSAGFIERARGRFLGCEFLRQSWDELPEGPFDAILLASALHYADDQPALVHRLVERLAPDGVLILELGIVSAPANEWVKVKRGIDERYFPTMAKLREVLAGYAWKWMGPSIDQAGDPVKRHIIHVSRRRPVAYLLLEPPGYGKSSIAASLFARSPVPVVSGDSRIDQAARNPAGVAPALARWLGDSYSPFELDRVIGGIFDAGHGAELLALWMEGVAGGDFALDAYVPEAHHDHVRQLLVEAGYLPVALRWQRVGQHSMPGAELARRAEEFYLSLGGSMEPGSGAGAPGTPRTPRTPIGFVDEVRIVRGRLLVRGWAIDSAGNLPGTLRVHLGTGVEEAADVERQLRTDVQRHHALPHALVGFRLSVDAHDLRRIEDLGSGFAVTAGADPTPFRLAAGVSGALQAEPRAAGGA